MKYGKDAQKNEVERNPLDAFLERDARNAA